MTSILKDRQATGFLGHMQNTTNRTVTANNDPAHKSTLSPVLDFFSRGAALRHNVDEAVRLFAAAYSENPQLALRCLFYIRDIRGGQGERDLFRAILGADIITRADLEKNLHLISEYGRWDDIFYQPSEEAHSLIAEQLADDIDNMDAGESVSLLAKWLPSEGASSKVTKKAALKVAKRLGLSPKEYRTTVSLLRAYIGLLEHAMSNREWETIDYSKLPSQALRKHIGAFKRHDLERFEKTMERAASDKPQDRAVTVNASASYPYELYEDAMSGKTDTADAQWNHLPDYTGGKTGIVMADVSGSMSGRPMAISVSLALYFAERNTGPFADYFMTFSAQPELIKVGSGSLSTKLRGIERSDWGMNTDVKAALNLILEAGRAYPEDVPDVLYIISDMQFDNCNGGSDGWYNSSVRANKLTTLEDTRVRFEAAGIYMPQVVFWNVSASDNSPATAHETGVTLVSGASPSSFRQIVSGETPTEFMEKVLNGERYEAIVTA